MKTDFVVDEGSSKEDAHIIGENIFGVFDGFDGLNKYVGKDGKTGGLIAATIAKETFSKNGKSLKDSAMEANQKIKEKMSECNIDTREKRNVWGTAFAVVRIQDGFFEWMQIGDSLILAIYKDDSFKMLVEGYDHDKELLKIWKKLAIERKENIRELIEAHHTEARNKMNIAYGVLNGGENAGNFIKSGVERLENVKHILLFTDGIFLPKKDPAVEDDWNAFVKLFLQGGLKDVKDYVRNLEKEDPKCWKYPRFKQYDDITAISISF